jgi:hypothetical protein
MITVDTFCLVAHSPYDSGMTQSFSLLFSSWTDGLGRPLTGSRALIPENVKVEGSRLVYSGVGALRRIDSSELLDQFVELASPASESRDIEAFARQYGPMHICERHGIASSHRNLLTTFSPLGPSPNLDEGIESRFCAAKLERRTPQTFSEPIETWRALAKRARRLLEIANTVRLSGKVSADDWRQVDGMEESFGKTYGTSWSYLDNPWCRIGANLDWWMVAADVCLRVVVDGPALSAQLGPNPRNWSSLSLVAIQLVLAITRGEGLAVCSGCAAPYIANRQPLAGKRVGRWIAKRNYCLNCRTAGVPQRDASRDYRRRKRGDDALD